MVVKKIHNIVTGESAKGLYENGELKLVATERPMTDFTKEVENQENECAEYCSTITTEKGNRFKIWCDTETCEYFISRI